MNRTKYTVLILMLITAQLSFSDSQDFDPSDLNNESYICRYEEQYYDGVGESTLAIKKLNNGYFIKWQGITDITEVYTDSDFNTFKMNLTDEDTKITVIRKENSLIVSGEDEGKILNKTLKIKTDNWFQLLPVSFIPFIQSDAGEIKFSMFDPYNIGIINMWAEKNETSEIEIQGTEYPVVKLNMRVKGFLSLFWKSEVWCHALSGLQIKYEGLNVVPKFYTAVISLKEIAKVEIRD